jgi:hypothetical protein
LGECPNGAITIVEREAEDFDEDAVEAYLEDKKHPKDKMEVPLACGCPSTHLQTFIPEFSDSEKTEEASQSLSKSNLSHWPVQIKLVPPDASFLNGADLLIAADCTPFAYPNFHRDFLKGRVVLVGCPKFDDVEEYILKFTEIFKSAAIKSITSLVMEVPCCAGLPMIVRKALDAAEKNIPIEEIVLSTRGEILKKEKAAA